VSGGDTNIRKPCRVSRSGVAALTSEVRGGKQNAAQIWSRGKKPHPHGTTSRDLPAPNARREEAQTNARLSTLKLPIRPRRVPGQKIASGLSGEPVPKAMRNGAAENRNS